MRVILNKDYTNLGEEGDVVNVKNGYARNFLIPKNIAVLDTKENRSYFKAKEGAIAKRKEEKRLQSRSIYEKLQNYEIVIALPSGDNGKLFGSVTNHMIHDKLASDGIEVERKKIEFPSVIKSVGTYNIEVGLYGGEKASVKLTVVAENKESGKPNKESKSKPAVADEVKNEEQLPQNEELEAGSGENAEVSDADDVQKEEEVSVDEKAEEEKTEE